MEKWKNDLRIISLCIVYTPERMNTQIIDTFKSYGLYNVNEKKVPVEYRGNGETRNLYKDQAKQGTGYTFYPSIQKYGVWTGRKPDGSFLITLDFDIYDRNGGYNESLEEYMNAMFESVDYQGVFSTSTEGNYQMVMDIQDCPEIIQHLDGRDKVSVNEGNACGLECMAGHNVILPPTATINKRTGEMGPPREFLSDTMIYRIQPDSGIVKFIKTYIPSTQVRKECETAAPELDLNDECVALIQALPKSYLKNRDTWVKIGYILKAHGYTWETFAQLSRTVSEYAHTGDDEYESTWESLKESKITKASLWYWLKNEDEKAYKELRRRFSSYTKAEFEDFMDEDFVDYLKSWVGDQFLSKSRGEGRPMYYYWNGDLWDSKNVDKVLKEHIVEMGREIMEDLNDSYLKETTRLSNELGETMDKEDESDIKKKMKSLHAAHLKRIMTVKRFTKMYKKQMDLAKSFKMSLTNDDYLLDQAIDVLNFKNGLLELRTGTFRKRVKEDMISQCLPYDYSQVKTETVQVVKELVRKIQPDAAEYEGLLAWLGYTLTGCVKAQAIKFNLGVGSNGKSLLNEIFEIALPLYTEKLDNRTFNENFNKAHKSLIKLFDRPIRNAYIEEIDTKRLAVDKLKDFTSGKQTTERLYTANESGAIQAKLNINSNYEPTIASDGGILRRCKMQMYPSKFVDNPTKSGEFKIDRNITERFETRDDMKCAFVQMLIPYAVQYFKDGLKIPESWERNFKGVAEDQDEWQDWFDTHFEREEGAWCVKQDVLDRAKDMVPNATWLDVRRFLKRIEMYDYEKCKMIQGRMGACRGFRLKDPRGRLEFAVEY